MPESDRSPALSREAKRQAARTTVAMLSQRWPKCFDPKNRRPLKIGIAQDLLSELGDAVPRSELKDALNLYCGDVGYLSTLRAGTSRLDLHGNEVGIVSRDDELRAAARLKAAKIARAKATTPATEENVPHQTSTPPRSAPPTTSATPARLGFEALRKAARERKAKGQVRDENKQQNET
jgi:sRNA-binding protein